uniref:Calmin n=1 Tax=Leptobrachium leishanense TaxID=445787 RepID=A0A8C5QE95_9ANUR
MALLEVLTGQSLLHEYKSSAHRIFRLNNIAKALKFLEDSNVKLVSIDAAEIADGNPSLVLGLIWNIILFLQIKELTGNLNRMSSSSSLSSLPSGTESETSQPSTPSTEKSMSVSIKDQRKAIKALLNWVQQRTRKFGVAVQDFGSSWKSGLAFLALIKAIDSSLVDIRKALERSPRENLNDAFSIAHRNLRIPRLLEPEDLMVDSPDEQSIMTYVTQFLEHFPGLDADDFAEEKEDVPLEMTYVHYKDGPVEEEGKIINVDNRNEKENGHHGNIFVMTPPRRKIEVPMFSPSREHINTEPTGAPGNQPPPLASKLDAKHVQAKNHTIFDSKDIPSNDASGKDPLAAFSDIKSPGDVGVTRLGYIKDNFILPNGRGPVNGIAIPEEKSSSPVPTYFPKQELNYVVKNNHNSSLDGFPSDKSPVSVLQKDNAEPVQTLDLKASDEGLVEELATSDKTEPSLLGDTQDSAKYVSHLPQNDSECDQSRRLTVFQVYKSGTPPKAEDVPDHKVLLQESGRSTPLTEVEESGSEDGSGDAKVSVIPHNLFYYPHYSVPIADVLHAFTENYPVGSKKKRDPTFSPEDQEDDFKCHNSSGTFSTTFEKENEISAPGSCEPSYAPEVTLSERQEWTLKANSETPVSPLKLLLNSSAPWESSSKIRNSEAAPGSDDADGVQCSGTSGKTQEHSDNSKTYLIDSVKQNVDEELKSEIIQDKSAVLDANLKEENAAALRFSRSSPKDSSLPFAKEQNIPHEMIPDAFDDAEEGREGHHTEPRKRRVGNARLLEKVDVGKKESLPSPHCRENVYYVILLIWVLLYCVLILPELDMDKVTFFSNNGI